MASVVPKYSTIIGRPGRYMSVEKGATMERITMRIISRRDEIYL